jgi:hypothetical protein
MKGILSFWAFGNPVDLENLKIRRELRELVHEGITIPNSNPGP